MVKITVDRKTGREISVVTYEDPSDVSLEDAIKTIAACIVSGIDIEKFNA